MLGGEGGLERVEALAKQQDPEEHAEENEALGHDLVVMEQTAEVHAVSPSGGE